MIARRQYFLLFAYSLAGCKPGSGGSSCTDLGASAEARKIVAVLDAANRFDSEADSLATDLEASCTAMAGDLTLHVPAAGPGELQVDVTCRAVRDEIQSILTAALPPGSALVITANPPQCSVALDPFTQCLGQCDASVTGMVAVQCQSGRIVGQCSGSCSGECRVSGNVTCAAQCRGTCTGTCSGTCSGHCDGTCSVMDSSGECLGTCTGTCSGSCSASCTGMCDGTCVSTVTGSCTGDCSGTCDVQVVAPRCEDGQAIVTADAQCRAACLAGAQSSAECTEPTLAITTTAAVDLVTQARLAALEHTLYRNYPTFLAVAARLASTVQAGQALAQAIDDASHSAISLSLQASACATAAAAATAQSITKLQASVSVTVDVNVALATMP